MKFAAIATLLCLGLTAATASPLPQSNDGDITVLRSSDILDDLGIVPNGLDSNDSNDDDDSKSRWYAPETSKLVSPDQIDKYARKSIVAKCPDDCKKFVSDTTWQCKEKFPGNKNCLASVEQFKNSCYNGVKKYGSQGLIFSYPAVFIKSDKPLTTDKECEADAYIATSKKWCELSYGPEAINNKETYALCKNKVDDLSRECKIAVSHSVPYPFFFPVQAQSGARSYLKAV
ncbi:hypothetical protein HDU96_010372 [Phlyctochytrium bullatum]|nr:hypothetical protein HDU96_010372 [Phlyctochytrium bullatum]